MATQPSTTTSNAPPPPPDSYIGCFVGVTSKSEIRYEGFIYYLNPQDSVFGLRDVRSYGTEGRAKNGPQVPPSEKVYEYILFRGSDVKDLQVKTTPSLPAKDPIYNDPAIIQSNNHVDSSSLSNSVPVIGGTSATINSYSESSALNGGPYLTTFPSHHSGLKFGTQVSFPLERTSASSPSYIMPADPTQRQGGFDRAPGSITGVNLQSLQSPTALFPVQKPAPTMMTSTNLQPSLTFHPPALINSNGLAMPFSLNHQSVNNLEDQVVNVAVNRPASLFTDQSFPYSASSVVDPPVLEQSARQQQTRPNRSIAQPNLSKPYPRNVYPDPKGVGGISSTPLNISGSASPAVQLNNLPLPPASQQLQSPFQFNEEVGVQVMNEKFEREEVWGHLGKANPGNQSDGIQEPGVSSQVSTYDNSDSVSKTDRKFHRASEYTEEFDFQGMNEKFKKDELWEYLGKVNHKHKVEEIHESGASSPLSGDHSPQSVSSKERKPPAYNKDDFFDSISGNSMGHGARNGQNQSSERQKLNYKTFSNFQGRDQSGYGVHSRGRGRYYHYRGRRGNWQR